MNRQYPGYIDIGLSQDPNSPRYRLPLMVAFQDAGAMSWCAGEETADALREAEGNNPELSPSFLPVPLDVSVVRLPTFIELEQMAAAAEEKRISGFDLKGTYWVANFGCQVGHGFTDFDTNKRGYADRSDVVNRVRLVR